MQTLKEFFGPLGNTFPFFGEKGTTAETILVTDALGVIGHRVAYKLLAAKYPKVRVGVSDVHQATDLETQGAQVVLFDFDRPHTYKDALHGVSHVYFAIPDHENWQDNFETFLNVMREEKIQHAVKLSICHSFVSKHDPFSKVPLVKVQRETDDKLVQFTKDYTIIMASHFMSNPTVYQEDLIRRERRFIGASGFKGVAYVSPNDVADVAVRALLAPKGFRKRTLHLTGDKVITDQEVADVLRCVHWLHTYTV